MIEILSQITKLSS